MYLFLDESGDLGFNAYKTGSSTYFVITIMVCQAPHVVKNINFTIKKTIKHKLNRKTHKDFFGELKGTNTSDSIKNYFFRKMAQIQGWSIYTLIVNKKNFVAPIYINDTHHLYNLFTNLLLREIPFKPGIISMVVDKCKSKKELVSFNRGLESIIFEKSKGKTKLFISHKASQEEKSIQAVDLFSYCIFKKYESNQYTWYSLFNHHITKEILI